MRKWKNPFLTLSLTPATGNKEIQARYNEIKMAEPDQELTARSAREELTQNIQKIIPAFLTAIPDLTLPEKQIKELKKRNRARKEINEELLSEAFSQLGLPAEQRVPTLEDVEFEVIDKMEQGLNLALHAKKRPNINKSDINIAPAITLNTATPIAVPAQIKE